nr:DegT/DnrJ/EryC1/StrS family aminotransferase [Neosynechococcus sphagnicola]
MYGHSADLPRILDLAHRYGLVVIEDCAQSHGATLEGRMTGSWGTMATFSFYPTKNLGALGDGGLVVTDDPRLAAKARQLREYGWKQRYISEIPGMNSRLDEIQAAILRVKLQALDRDNAQRQQLAEVYQRRLSQTNLTLPPRSGSGQPRLPSVCDSPSPAPSPASLVESRSHWHVDPLSPARPCPTRLPGTCLDWGGRPGAHRTGVPRGTESADVPPITPGASGVCG